ELKSKGKENKQKDKNIHFVECHRAALINRVSETGAILDKLREKDLISDENYDNVRGFKTTRNQMREILKIVTTKKGKDALYEILKGMKSLRPLMSELQGSQ
uniref:CARD domain-containing protein n=1 Tax=Amphilophus citrinellus TaxID=61819 RepID=A0A3Q0RPJ6_AMPCI